MHMETPCSYFTPCHWHAMVCSQCVRTHTHTCTHAHAMGTAFTHLPRPCLPMPAPAQANSIAPRGKAAWAVQAAGGKSMKRTSGGAADAPRSLEEAAQAEARLAQKYKEEVGSLRCRGHLSCCCIHMALCAPSAPGLAARPAPAVLGLNMYTALSPHLREPLATTPSIAGRPRKCTRVHCPRLTHPLCAPLPFTLVLNCDVPVPISRLQAQQLARPMRMLAMFSHRSNAKWVEARTWEAAHVHEVSSFGKDVKGGASSAFREEALQALREGKVVVQVRGQASV